jgi:hypothetical protein
MIAAMVLASATGASAPARPNSKRGVQQHEQRDHGAGTRSMKRGTSANGGVGTGGVTTGSGSRGEPPPTPA